LCFDFLFHIFVQCDMIDSQKVCMILWKLFSSLVFLQCQDPNESAHLMNPNSKDLIIPKLLRLPRLPRLPGFISVWLLSVLFSAWEMKLLSSNTQSVSSNINSQNYNWSRIYFGNFSNSKHLSD
jgi:hypothetical protein